MVLALLLLELASAGLGGSLVARPAHAEDVSTPDAVAVEARQKRNSLLGVLEALKRERAALTALQGELESNLGRGREAEIVSEIQESSKRIEELELSFSEIASGVDPRLFDESQEAPIDFTNELRDLLGPLIHELRRMTSRPREIDRLRSEISDARERLLTLDRALDNVARLRELIQDPVVGEKLRVEQATWEKRQESVRTQLAVARQKLEQKENERTTISETVQHVFQLFFKSRGRNLLLALLATIVFLLVLRRLHQELHKRSPLGRDPTPSFRARLFNLLFAVFTAVGGVLVFLIVLYVFGDWVLLILVILLIMGLVWASKQALPAFWSQATLLLDMGVVRQGERLVYHGVAYQVKSLGFYTLLENPLLTGGSLRLPINDLADLRSRPFDESERWFATREGDWVLLGEGRLAQVVHQSPEAVRVMWKGGAVQVFPTADFPGQAPLVLSEGFRLSVTFGVDYAHVEIVTGEVAARLERFVAEGLAATPHGEQVRSVRVEFESAGASSLDLAVLCDFQGGAACDYEVIKRLVNRLCVDASNANGWVIPFQQITLHVAAAPTPEA